MSHSFRFDPTYTSKVQRAKFAHEQAQRKECVDRAFVSLQRDALDDEIENAALRADIARKLLAR